MKMWTTRTLGALTCAAALVAAGAGTANAGEITGNGTYKEVHGRSICAYSGQNDAFHDPTHQEDPSDTGRVQSYGQIVRAGFKAVAPSPGLACNPDSGLGE